MNLCGLDFLINSLTCPSFSILTLKLAPICPQAVQHCYWNAFLFSILQLKLQLKFRPQARKDALFLEQMLFPWITFLCRTSYFGIYFFFFQMLAQLWLKDERKKSECVLMFFMFVHSTARLTPKICCWYRVNQLRWRGRTRKSFIGNKPAGWKGMDSGLQTNHQLAGSQQAVFMGKENREAWL